MKAPPAHAAAVHRAAVSIRKNTADLWLLFAVSGTWLGSITAEMLSDKVFPFGRYVKHSAGMKVLRSTLALLGRLAPMTTVALGGLMLLALGLYGSVSVSLYCIALTTGLWALYVLVLGMFVGHIAQRGSALRRRVWWMTGRSGLLLSSVAILGALVPDAIWSAQSGGPPWLWGLGVVWLLGLLSLVRLPSAWVSLLQSFWVPDLSRPNELLQVIDKHIREGTNLRVRRHSCGLQVNTNRRDGGRIKMSLDVAHFPGRLIIYIKSKSLREGHPGLSIHRRQSDSPPGVALANPILQGVLVVEADEPARVADLLDEKHEILLPLFHAWEDVSLDDGCLRLSIVGPPFPGASQPADVGRFVVQRLVECQELMDALQDGMSPAVAQARRRRKPLRQ